MNTDVLKYMPGNYDIKTMEKYTHVSRYRLVQIRSPLDDLWLKGEIL